jgi:glycosyltransferase involved in cell wall biosynthesis
MSTSFKKATLTIGIPAFNEAANIGYLLDDLNKQRVVSASVKKIIIVSDGSTDQTVNISRTHQTNKGVSLMIVQHKVRKGRAERQNEILKLAESDILVLLDADVMLEKSNFIDQLIKPIVAKRAELTSARIQEIEDKGLINKVLLSSMQFKRTLFESVNNGDNLYTCHGRARAFAKILYKQIIFKDSVGEDAYSYLFAVSCGFRYQFVKTAEVFYKLPATFSDHEKQSIRFFNTQKMFEKEFGKDFVDKENYLSLLFIIKHFIGAVFKNPYLFIYVVIATYLKIKSFFNSNFANDWSISQSSKNVRGQI